MQKNMPNKDIRTLGIVLRRTNYGEADRILNIMTPEGKIAAIAKGARRERSKRAGGIEMFSLVDLNIHQGKSEFGIVTSAKMIKYYSEILKDYNRMELAALILKKINAASENLASGEYFEIANQCLIEINAGADLRLVEGWFWLNLSRVMGEEMNLYRDKDGQKLEADESYSWSVQDQAFGVSANGEIGVNEIKMLRLMATTSLEVAKRVKVSPEMLGILLALVRVACKVR